MLKHDIQNRCNITKMKDKKSQKLECQKEVDQAVADQVASCTAETEEL